MLLVTFSKSDIDNFNNGSAPMIFNKHIDNTAMFTADLKHVFNAYNEKFNYNDVTYCFTSYNKLSSFYTTGKFSGKPKKIYYFSVFENGEVSSVQSATTENNLEGVLTGEFYVFDRKYDAAYARSIKAAERNVGVPYIVRETGHDYDFARIVENLTNRKLFFEIDEKTSSEFNTFYKLSDDVPAVIDSNVLVVEPKDWIGLPVNEYIEA